MPGSSLTPPPSLPTAISTYAPPAGFASHFPQAEEPAEVPPLQRMIAALLRYKWLVVAMAIVGGAAGLFIVRQLQHEYEVQGTIWVSAQSPSVRQSGPIRAGELLTSSSWPDLLRSFAILDEVASDLGLFVHPVDPASEAAVRGMTAGAKYTTGNFELTTDATGRSYTLTRVGQGVVERGQVGDSIGRSVGLLWRPAPQLLGSNGRVAFGITTPREAAVYVRSRMITEMPREGNLVRVRMTGTDPALTAQTLNGVMRRFVTVAADLKRRNLTEVSRTLERQLALAERELRDAEIALESFRVRTITLPAEGTTVAPGLEQTRDPVFAAYFERKVALENLAHDRQALERTLADVRRGALDVDALGLVIPADNTADGLRAALNEYSTREAALRAALQVFTEEHRTVRDHRTALQGLRERTIPQLAATVVEQLRRREADLDTRIQSASAGLKAIPTRTIEEMRLRRNVEVRAALYTSLRNRFEEAHLAEASAMPDVAVLDSAVRPLQPLSNRGPMLFIAAVGGCIAIAILIAILLDRFDARFRYPEQVGADFGLRILGAIPTITRSRRKATNALQLTQLVEAFRSLRLNVSYALPADGKHVLTVTSPGPHDGKSFTSVNLALAYAEAGYRTVIVDADVRRGALHDIFGAERGPGLIERLRGDAELDDVLRPTTHDRLSLIPTGRPMRKAPELLASSALLTLLDDLRARFDVIVVDSSPLGAGIDPFALAAATGHTLLVLRVGATDRRVARVKLDLLRRLPTTIVGTAINDVKGDNVYREYGYLSEYGMSDDDDASPFAGALTRAGRG